MFLLAVSGGPDSMFMLNEYKKKNIIVAHINYNTRDTSKSDEDIVRKFCKDNNIKFKMISVRFSNKGNFENWARDIRYDFFAKVYKENNCTKLLTAHHKDDFIETALMQQRSNRNPKFFGIRKKISRLNMNILRPYVNLYWKEDILKYVKSDKIPFGIDETNFDPHYSSRNKVRAEIKTWSNKKKKDVYQWFRMSNKILAKKNKKVDETFKKWSQDNFSQSNFRNIRRYKQEIAYEFLTRKFENLNITEGKIKSFIDFIEGPNGNVSFKLNSKDSVIKEKGLIKIKKIK